MEGTSNLQIALDSLDGLTKSELKQVEQTAFARRLELPSNYPHLAPNGHFHGSTHQLSRPSSIVFGAQASPKEPRAAQLFQLPIELRFMIYELVATPKVAEAHIKKNKIPALLQVNRETRDDFASYYYGRKVFRVELFKNPTSTWEEVINPARVQAMFEGWSLCYVDEDLRAISELKGDIDDLYGGESHDDSRKGALTWIGESNGEGVKCSFWEHTKSRTHRTLRSEQLASVRASVERMRQRDAKKKAKQGDMSSVPTGASEAVTDQT